MLTRHIFLSYSRADAAIMARVREALRAEGLNMWTDERLQPGSPEWEREIESAIKSGGGVVVLLSPSSNESIWVRREIAFAEAFNVRIFPVLVSGNEQTAVPARLINHQRIDIRRTRDYEAQVSRLVDALCAHAGIERESSRRMRQAQEERARQEKAQRQEAAGPAPEIPAAAAVVGRSGPASGWSALLTLATWLPLALPLLGSVLGVFPYSNIIFTDFSPSGWLAILVICVALLFVLDRRLPSSDKWSARAGLGYMVVFGLITLAFACLAVSPFYFWQASPFAIVSLLSCIAVACQAASLSILRRFADGTMTVPSHNLAAMGVGLAAAGALVGFPAGYIVRDTVRDLTLLMIISVVINVVAAAIVFVILSFAAEPLSKVERPLNRILAVLYVIAVAAEVYLVFFNGWGLFR
ncbi:MAG: TIR domain-containing protein [Chloroflexi bacterium]|nr:TIR domain-containing protein [Chloroflexota bacterium]